MGGLAGHLQHVYEDIGLTFRELKDILRDASTGRLESVTEKLDGQNIFFGYRDGSLRFARNLGDLRRGGMTKAEVDRKWLDKPSVQAAFSQAYDVLSSAVERTLSVDERVELFGVGGENWYSAEILSVENPNIIVYGQNVISPHLFGVKKFNATSGHLEDPDGENVLFRKLLDVAAKLDAEMSEQSWKLAAPVIYPLVKLGSKQPLKDAIESLDAIMAEVGLGDQNKVSDYIKAKLGWYLKPYGIDGSIADELGKRMTGDEDKVAKINSLKKYAADEEQYVRIVALDRNKKKIFKTIAKPIEDVITKFASELLEGSKSLLVKDHSSAAQQMRNELSVAIEKIKTSPDAMAALGDHMARLQNIDRLTSTIEGVVFRRNGKSYKFTGQFAPINQLVGALRYGGRGYDDEEGFVLRRNPSASQSITIFPGAFKPYHKGHDRVVRLASMQSDKVLLIVSDGDREKSGELPVLGQTMKEVWQKYIIPTLPANVRVEFADNPVSKAYESLRALDDQTNPSHQVNMLAGDEDIGRFRHEALAIEAPGLASKSLINIASVPRFGGVSGTDMRSFLALGDSGKFINGLPHDVARSFGGEIFSMLRKSGLKRLKDIQQQNTTTAKKPRLTEVFTEKDKKTMGTPTTTKQQQPKATNNNVKLGMKDLAKLVKESLKESLSEMSGGSSGDAADAGAHAKLMDFLHNALYRDETFDVFQFIQIVQPLLPQGGAALHTLKRAAEGVLQKHREDPKREPRVLELDDMRLQQFRKLVDAVYKPLVQAEKDERYRSGQSGQSAPPATPSGAGSMNSTVKEDVGAAMADDAAVADQEMVMEAIAAAYKAGLSKGREQATKQLQELAAKKNSQHSAKR